MIDDKAVAAGSARSGGGARDRLLIVRWGELRVHDLNMAYLLAQTYEVEFALFTPHYAYRGKAGRSFVEEAEKNFRVHEWRAGLPTRQLVRLHSALERVFRLSQPLLTVGVAFPFRLRALVKAKRYDILMPIEQHSLYCAWRGAAGLATIVYYSLEVQTPSDEDVSFNLRPILLAERSILPRVDGILIQDASRLAVLGASLATEVPGVQFLPLFSSRSLYEGRSDFLRSRLGIDSHRRIVLYYGAFYAERFINELAGAFRDGGRDDLTLVLHNPQMNAEDAARFAAMGDNVRPSATYLEPDELDDMVASADAGIALYDNDKPNTRFTAYSSEKIVTYLRCGVPFIAFDNESYQDLKAKYDCCALIDKIDQIPAAAASLMANAEHHWKEARRAYQDVFHRTELVLKAGGET